MALLEPQVERIAPEAGEPAADRAPDWVATGSPQPLRGELESLLGPDRVLSRPTDLVRYASDASPYRLFPKAVVMARDAEDVSKLLGYARRSGTPLTFRSGGTSLNGQGQSDAILVDVRRHFTGVEVEAEGARARVGPGTTLGHVNRVLAAYGRKLGPDPASTDFATVGGVIANNSGGMRCGVEHDSYSTVRALTLLLPSGTLIDTEAPDAEARFAESEPELARRSGADPGGDPRRRRARGSHPAQVPDQEHHRVPAVRVPRRGDAAGDLPAAGGRLGGHPGLPRGGRVRDRAPAPEDDHGLGPLRRHRGRGRAGAGPGGRRGERRRADGGARVDRRGPLDPRDAGLLGGAAP